MGEAPPRIASGIVDAHVHLYPREVAENPAAWGEAHSELAWAECVAPKGRRSIQGWSDPDALVADMDAAGVAACVMLGWYWERQETCDLQNGWYAQWIRRNPGRLMAFASVQPSAGTAATDALERALDSGLCGIGELLPSARGPFLRDPHWRRVFEIASSRALPVTLHATDPHAGPAAGPPTPLGDYFQLALEFPRVPIILAHFGGGLALRDFPGLEGPLPDNLYFDTAASPLLYGSTAFRSAVDRIGAGRIIFGSDYPLILYPREGRKPGFARFLGEIAGVGLTEIERDLVLGSNIRRLLAPGLAPAPKRV
jgi:predicted TIM-barrel fold metal-dependent hydrolase